ncbi:predicted protein [Aspergillus nidulans FGSC A4]|uniref:Uncharacterized protein n=1 Tax=Emericella nidulans (strain FGSC A4 / ATCC 38163 / CBS 112.46 / NRRL 194 / M139) TaxID=227321 RepID=Q5BGI9_EMENI|nr:hypothetical protein [Aspergillus nidulans FGSC A4]EAA65747.1 predicted protein [Aspergillus nidulans FGSC A4]CBF89687.1 TPA: hypothetical protein ANIA_00341 [Aspergillus nidulans FGSC A4]|eukprot:XP_657945.1 predicted protein [Aspergillus nidulans FGSC A4]
MSLSNDDHVVLLLSSIRLELMSILRVRLTSPPSHNNATSPLQEPPHREGKAIAGDNGAPAGTGPSEVNQGQTQTQNQNQTASGAAKKGRKRKEPAPKEDGNGDEPAPKRKRGRPPKAKAPTEIAAEEGEDGTSKEETDQASNTHRAFGGDETMDEDEEA